MEDSSTADALLFSTQDFTESAWSRFWEKVEKSESCWNWNSAKDLDGYGVFQLGVKLVRKSHRVSYAFHNGPFDRRLLVCHRCDNPSCVNPEHLFLGTVQDNNRDRDEKGRRGVCRGSSNGASKLQESDIPKIKQLISEGVSQSKIGALFGISQTAVSKIKLGKMWFNFELPSSLV